MNNPEGRDGARPGAVPRPGLAGLDPESGVPVSWNPGRNPRGVGAGALLATSAGLWVGSDTEYIGNFQYRRPRIAFFPVEGGMAPPTDGRWTLPANLYQGGRTAVSGDASLTRRWHTGSAIETTDAVSGSGVAWDQVRGAFVVDGSLFYGAADGLMYRRTWTEQAASGRRNSSTLQRPVLEHHRHRLREQCLSRKPTEPVRQRARRRHGHGVPVGSHRVHPIRVEPAVLALVQPRQRHRRSETQRVAGAVMPMTCVGCSSPTATCGTPMVPGPQPSALNGVALVPGSTQLMGGPTVDGVDWRSRALFAGPGPQPPANVLPDARFAISCTQLTCSFDASTSADPDGTITSYRWTFSDGATASGVSARPRFASAARTRRAHGYGQPRRRRKPSSDITVSAGNVAPTSASALRAQTCRARSTGPDPSTATGHRRVRVEFGDGRTPLESDHDARRTPAPAPTRLASRSGRRRSANDAGASVSVTAAPGDHRLPRVANRAGDIHDRDHRHACAERSRRRPAPVRNRQLADTDDPRASGMDRGGRQTAGTMVTVSGRGTATAADSDRR